jgi:hypothetical protein
VGSAFFEPNPYPSPLSRGSQVKKESAPGFGQWEAP